MANTWLLRLEIMFYILSHPNCPEPDLRAYLLGKNLFSAMKTLKDHLKGLEYMGLIIKTQGVGKSNIWNASDKGIQLIESRVIELESELKHTKAVLDRLYMLEEKREVEK